MTTSNNPTRWWQHEIDGPIRLTFACCTAVAALLAAFGFIAGGVELAALLAPMGVLCGASLSLRLGKDASTQKWSRFVDGILARTVKAVFIYGFPFWVYVAIKYGVGFTIVCAGGISALLLFGISGTTGLAVAFSHTILLVQKRFLQR